MNKRGKKILNNFLFNHNARNIKFKKKNPCVLVNISDLLNKLKSPSDQTLH